MKDSTVNSAGGSFCWNYATDTFYSNYTGANVCCSDAGFEVLLQLCRWYIPLKLLLQLLLLIFVAITQVTVSVAIMQLEVSAAFMQVTVSAANMWVTISIEIMQVGISVAIIPFFN